MAFELRFSIEDELRIYARLLDELMRKSPGGTSTTTATTIRSTEIERSSSTGRFDLASSHSGWTQPTTLYPGTENLFKTTEDEIHETYDGDSIIQSSSFSTHN